MAKGKLREDHIGPGRTLYQKNRKRLFAMQSTCAICGKPVDFSLKFPDPMSATADHIIPVEKGGSAYDISNLQLAHLSCNLKKGSKTNYTIQETNNNYKNKDNNIIYPNNNLEWSAPWTNYRCDEENKGYFKEE